jgi:hypothetical protein
MPVPPFSYPQLKPLYGPVFVATEAQSKTLASPSTTRTSYETLETRSARYNHAFQRPMNGHPTDP